MRLTDLDPHWLTFNDRRVGFIFRCPLSAPDKRKWWQTCFVEKFYLFKGRDGLYEPTDADFMPDSQTGIVATSLPEARECFQGCETDCQWNVTGGIGNASFDTITVTPSLDGEKGGLWHGTITNGEMLGGLS